MQNTEKAADTEAVSEGAKLPWVTPKLTIVPVGASEADPTVGDDGLAAGLFS
ncbi:hypothetical protein PY365_09020 [Roseiarcaceae bacterium H3SJ34-1]|uniref:hypothetical protein n=1 Tax=Terripilifer ovatus TaxID=3032367 RepID=UPI003AB9524F|nr:hypothetical protein [Roseiarcaceae bacterium H3SJ34-1]